MNTAGGAATAPEVDPQAPTIYDDLEDDDLL
jgi:hypothetical protein